MHADRKDISIVTGSGSGIGRAIALKLANEGFHVAVIDLDETAARSTTRDIVSQGDTAEQFYVDITDQSATRYLSAAANRLWSRTNSPLELQPGGAKKAM